MHNTGSVNEVHVYESCTVQRMFGTWSLWATSTWHTSTNDACLEFKISGYGYIPALSPTMHTCIWLFQILGHRNVTKLQLIMHAWYLELWTMQKLHISNNNACLVFKNLGHTCIATRSYKAYFHQHLLLQQCSFALKYEIH